MDTISYIIGQVYGIFGSSGLIYTIEIAHDVGEEKRIKVSFGKGSYYNEYEFTVLDNWVYTGIFVIPTNALARIKEEIEWIKSQPQ